MTTLERTLSDLVEERTDLTLVADTLRDAIHSRQLDLDRLEELLRPLAARNGFRSGDGGALLDHLKTLAGIDMTHLAREVGASKELSMRVAANALTNMHSPEMAEVFATPAAQQALEKVREAIAQVIEPSLTHTLNEVSASLATTRAMAQLQAHTTRISQKIAEDLPTREILASLGERIAASLETDAFPRSDVARIVDAIGTIPILEITEPNE